MFLIVISFVNILLTLSLAIALWSHKWVHEEELEEANKAAQQLLEYLRRELNIGEDDDGPE